MLGAGAMAAGVASAGAPSPSAAHRATSAPRDGMAPLSSGWLEWGTSAGTTSYVTGPATLGSSASFSQMLTTVAAPSGSILVGIEDGSGTPFAAGQSYASSSQVTILVQGRSVNCTAGAQGQGTISVDQLVHDNHGAVSAVAFRFTCSSGGTTVTGAVAFAVEPSTPHLGYYTYRSNGSISGFGNDHFLNYLGDPSAAPLNRPIVGMAVTADGGGYWMVASDGGIFALGDAVFYGSAGAIHLNEPIVGMAATVGGGGYWLVASDGGIFAYGDAVFGGSMGGHPLNRPVVGMAPSPIGGYWLVAGDGGIFSFGGAPFYGSTGNLVLNRPVVGMDPTPDGGGYWFVAADGGVFSYGNAGFHGSTGALTLVRPVVGMLATPGGTGYWLVASDGGIFAFDAPYSGSLGGTGLTDVTGLDS